jgi:hypothetical protein
MRRVAVVLALLVMGCSSGTTEPAADPTQPVEPATATAPTDPAEPATTAGATDVTVPTDTVASPKGPFRWERVDPADETIPGGMAAVVAGGPGLVAVGVDGSGGDYDAAVWTSSDGYVWERVAHDEAVFGGAEDQIVRGLAVGGPGFVATGFDASGGDRDMAVWTSPDGRVWTRVADAEGVFGGPGDQDAVGVVATDDTVVAVGYEQDENGDQNVAVWTSPDGIAWTRIPHDEAVFGGEGSQSMGAVTHGDSGFVGVGYDAEVFGSPPDRSVDFDGAVWLSPDGTNWSRVSHDEVIFGGDDWQLIGTVTASAAGYVALGGTEENSEYDVRVWTSTDGADWVRAAPDEAELGGAGEQIVQDVVASDIGFLAVGRDASGGDDDAAIWLSTDGLAWTQLDSEAFGGPGTQEARGVAVLDDLAVAVGVDRVMGEPMAVVWVGRHLGVDESGAEPDPADQALDESPPPPEESERREEAPGRAESRSLNSPSSTWPSINPRRPPVAD